MKKAQIYKMWSDKGENNHGNVKFLKIIHKCSADFYANKFENTNEYENTNIF